MNKTKAAIAFTFLALVGLSRTPPTLATASVALGLACLLAALLLKAVREGFDV